MFSIRYCSFIALALFSLEGFAGVITNGDFSNPIPLDGFDTFGSVTESDTGTNQFALFDNDGVLEHETFTLPSTASVLSFDFAFSTASTPATAPLFADSFSGTLTPSFPLDVLQIFVADVYSTELDPSDRFQAFYGTTAIDVTYDSTVSIPGFEGFANGTTFSGRISLSLPDELRDASVTLAFDLFDSDLFTPPFDSIAAVDNIAVTPDGTVIPEPASLAIWMCVVVPCMCFGRLRKRTRTS